MGIAIRFKTALFDVSKERENPINPIPGESLLVWLGNRLTPGHTLSPPEPEDWGWCSSLTWKGRVYLVGSCAYDEENGDREWVLQIDKMRSASEKLFGREKMKADDECAAFLKQLLEGETAVTGVSVD